MAEGGVPYPSVFMVDSHAAYPPLPPKPRPPGRGGVAQSLLFLLVGLALCGLAIEACFIYHLYSKQGSVSIVTMRWLSTRLHLCSVSLNT
jgi:hypothetical protein